MNVKSSEIKNAKAIIRKQNSTVIGFDRQVNFRIRQNDFREITKITNKNQDLFYNESHFIRCAVLKMLREFDSNGKKVCK
jgi:hypothetical protein